MSGIRVFGLSGSGIDVDQIVSDMVDAERDIRVTKLEREKQLEVWTQEAYQEINTDIANFILDIKEEFGLSSTTSTGVLLNKSSDSFTWVKSASSSDETKITATATTKALNGNYKINVTQLAENVSKTSVGAITTGTSGTLFEQFGDVFDDDGGDATNTDSLKFTIKTNLTDDEGVDFEFDPTVDSIEDVVDEINNAGIGVTAAYDEDLDRFFLNTSSTGAENYFEIVSDEDNFLAGSTGDGSDNTLKLKLQVGTQYNGKDLEFDFGDATGLTKSSNTFSVNGINMTASDTGETTISVNTDVDSVYEKITEFVDKYNELIGSINEKLSEEVYSDYYPLTDEEKEAMTEDQAEQWEELAKSGLLKNDSILSRTISNLRIGLYQSVEGLNSSINQLTKIGIETGEYSSKGKLVIDETKLKEAIINDAEGVIDLFFKTPDSDEYTTDEEKYNQSGLINRVFDDLVNGMKDIIDKAGPGDDSELLRDVQSTILVDFSTGKNLKNAGISWISESILDLEDEIERQEDILENLEDRYYSKYIAMETALSEMNSQSSWISSQLG